MGMNKLLRNQSRRQSPFPAGVGAAARTDLRGFSSEAVLLLALAIVVMKIDYGWSAVA
jgi:hypothetical protein